MNRHALPKLFLLALVLGPASVAQDPKPGDGLLMGQPRADFAARRRTLMEKVAAQSPGRPDGPGPVVVLRGGDTLGLEDFEVGRFRQRNYFAYLTGVETPGAWLVLLPRTGRATLYLPPRPGASVMNGESNQPGPGPDAAKELGFDAAEPTARLLGDVFEAIGCEVRPAEFSAVPGTPVYVLGPDRLARDDRPDAKLVRMLREGAPNADYRDLTPIVDEMRKVKSPAEMAILQTAIDITGEANRAVMARIAPDLREYQLEAVIHAAFTDGGALRAGFSSIVGSGPNATIPHYFENSRPMKPGDLVVVDIGAEYKNYTADVTRTYPVDGRFTPRQRELYQLVLDAQAEVERRARPNQERINDMTEIARAYLRQSPLRARDDAGVERTMDHFLVHGVSHYLGMDVHDVGDNNAPIKPGEVFTIEPGVYIKGENIGIRIEDDYLMTDSGLKKLSKAIPGAPADIEAGIAAARAGSKAR